MRNTELMDQRRPALLPPVLCYHRIGGPAELGVTRVARSVFARQMTTLARAGWKTLTLDQFAERLRPGHSALRTPHSAFLLTFDDGYASSNVNRNAECGVRSAEWPGTSIQYLPTWGSRPPHSSL